MQRNRVVAIGFVGLIVLGAGAVAAKLWFLPESSTTVHEDLPPAAASSEPTILKTGTFEAGDPGHDVQGTIQILEIDGARYLRFIDYHQTQGPDVFVYLTTHDRPDSRAKVEGGTRILIDGGADEGESTKEGTFNQHIPDGVDLASVRSVAIWCDDFNVLFGYATLGA